MRFGAVRLQFQGPTVAGKRLVQSPLVFQRIAEVVVYFGQVRRQFQPASKADQRVVQLPLLPQRKAQVTVCLGIVRVQFQSPAEAGKGLRCPSQRTIRLPQVVMEESHIPFQPDRPRNVFHGTGGIAHLVAIYAEKMERVGMIRLDGENLPVDLLGSPQPTRLLVANRSCQRLGVGYHGVTL